ncbi:MAG: hypothetical protein HQL56_17980 [Magnetococcales bacterium]|nr:hypothetical protein [Magnetococcales bacterium]
MPISNTAAGGQALGYYYQERRCLFWLLSSQPGDVVAFEKLGDVAVEKDDGSVTTEEDKSSTTGNPVADRSVDLWKTFYNWLNAIIEGRLTPLNTRFILSVLQNVSGMIANGLHGANSRENSGKQLQIIRNTFHQNPPKSNIKKYIDKILSKEHEENVLLLIESFRLETGSGDSSVEVFELFQKANQSLDLSEAKLVFEACSGWVKSEIMKQLEQGGSYAIIPVKLFRTRLREITLNLRDNRILNSFTNPPNPDDVDSTVSAQPIFLRQLDLIDYEDEKFEAAKHYLWAYADITDWSEKGTIDGQTFDKFHQSLMERWRDNNKRSKLAHPSDEISQGQSTYLECKKLQISLDGKIISEGVRFIPGVYHDLSNKRKLGWHPDYLRLLPSEYMPEDDAT